MRPRPSRPSVVCTDCPSLRRQPEPLGLPPVYGVFASAGKGLLAPADWPTGCPSPGLALKGLCQSRHRQIAESLHAFYGHCAGTVKRRRTGRHTLQLLHRIHSGLGDAQRASRGWAGSERGREEERGVLGVLAGGFAARQHPQYLLPRAGGIHFAGEASLGFWGSEGRAVEWWMLRELSTPCRRCILGEERRCEGHCAG